MLAFTLRRLLISIPVLLLSTILVFLLVASTGDPLDELKHRNPPVPKSTILDRERFLHLDKSLFERYWLWLSGVFRGDFGPSIRYSTHTGSELGTRFLVTLRMVAAAMLIAALFAVAVGVLSAVKQYSKTDYAFTFFGFLCLSMPAFWLAVLLKQVLAIKINQATGRHVLDTIGASTPDLQGGIARHVTDDLSHLVLPTLTLALISYASWSRFQRGSMLDVLNSDYLRLARSKGLSRWRVMTRHALRTALIPLTTVMAIDFAGILGGAIITERVFQWHGMGEFGLNGIVDGDVYVVLDWLLISAVAVIVFNLLADILYAVLDPRIRYA